MAQSAGSENFTVQRFVAFAGMPASLQRSLQGIAAPDTSISAGMPASLQRSLQGLQRSLQGIAAPDASLQQPGWRLKKSLKCHMYYIFCRVMYDQSS